ncbi:hypothetical protein PRIPAC_96038 [Pristionchus pacificus]|uniref:Dynein light chain n=1 Tax=Pristionchus pacificus TaxID=54126 RepID=A0A2A6CUM2_PRIPA|nr:hypothetical protein PRIPAC_96038 [Pristionchus pacificus]|eukprot:PDM81747.1 hypothetical protein PRIPAC_30728 [Pristionchus pacificus]
MNEVPLCLSFPYCTVYVLGEAEETSAPSSPDIQEYPGKENSKIKLSIDCREDSDDSGMSSITSRKSTRIRGSDDQSSSSRTGEKKATECVVKSTDMPEEMQRAAMQVAVDAMSKYRVEKDIATYIKEEFDKRYLPSWHCVVGRNFGSYVTHETNHFIYFYIQHVAVMLFKTGF